jgi:hypothetical protein
MTTISKCVVIAAVCGLVLTTASMSPASEFSLGCDRAGQLRAVTGAAGQYQTLAYDAPGNPTLVVSGSVAPDLDTDGDGLTDLLEILIGTRPDQSDSDGDGMPDGWEHANGLDPLADDGGADKDGDGLTNFEEYSLGTNPSSWDTDGDGLPDGWEVRYSMNPLAADSNNDGVRDADEDADGDGHTNGEEYRRHSDPNDPESVPKSGLQVPSYLLLLLDE